MRKLTVSLNSGAHVECLGTGYLLEGVGWCKWWWGSYLFCTQKWGLHNILQPFLRGHVFTERLLRCSWVSQACSWYQNWIVWWRTLWDRWLLLFRIVYTVFTKRLLRAPLLSQRSVLLKSELNCLAKNIQRPLPGNFQCCSSRFLLKMPV